MRIGVAIDINDIAGNHAILRTRRRHGNSPRGASQKDDIVPHLAIGREDSNAFRGGVDAVIVPIAVDQVADNFDAGRLNLAGAFVEIIELGKSLFSLF